MLTYVRNCFTLVWMLRYLDPNIVDSLVIVAHACAFLHLMSSLVHSLLPSSLHFFQVSGSVCVSGSAQSKSDHMITQRMLSL